MERGGESRSVRHLAPTCRPPQAIGAEAGRRAVARAGPRKIASTTAPVIFENRIAAQVLSPLIGAISGPSIARGTSFLKDRLGQRVLPEGVNLIDDPLPPARPGLHPLRRRGRGRVAHGRSSTTAS